MINEPHGKSFDSIVAIVAFLVEFAPQTMAAGPRVLEWRPVSRFGIRRNSKAP